MLRRKIATPDDLLEPRARHCEAEGLLLASSSWSSSSSSTSSLRLSSLPWRCHLLSCSKFKGCRKMSVNVFLRTRRLKISAARSRRIARSARDAQRSARSSVARSRVDRAMTNSCASRIAQMRVDSYDTHHHDSSDSSLIVRDGWGKNPFPQWNHANAVHLAKHPVADRLMAEYPNVLIAHQRVRRRPARGHDGQQRGRPPEHRRRADRRPGVGADHQGDPQRRRSSTTPS